VVDALIDGTLPADKERLFSDIYRSLLFDGNPTDPYFVLADFESYKDAHMDVLESYKDRKAFIAKAVMNTACAGVFSSDRTILDYNANVWRLTPLTD